MQNKSAFTLIETLIAVTLMTVVITAVTGLILTTILANERNQRTLQATALAQEGLELMRYMRDSNWLQNYTWNDGAALWSADFVPKADGTARTIYVQVGGANGASIVSSGEITLGTLVFERAITLEAVMADGTAVPDEEKATATVTWQERGQERSVELSTYLTNWK